MPGSIHQYPNVLAECMGGENSVGNYLNPGNIGFAEIRNDMYVDKSGLIGLINDTIDTSRKLTCVSRPRRFGKSFAAKMLCAYYDKTCDSSRLFDDLEIGRDNSPDGDYKKHLNRYDVIYLDMTSVMEAAGKDGMIEYIKRNVTQELAEVYPKLVPAESFAATLSNAAGISGNKFVMIIDEWDAPIREYSDVQKPYMDFLRALFKNSGMTDKIFSAVYMTGILPIKKDRSESAISDFNEFHMIKPRMFAPYVGFTEADVRKLCDKYARDFSKMKQWYDGYTLKGAGSVYNPNSVIQAVRYDDFDSYWRQSSAAESLRRYIEMDFDGLSKAVAELLGGVDVPVDTAGFENDTVTFQTKDDILALMIHLGYLSYDEMTETVHIPNEEIQREFARVIRGTHQKDTVQRIRECDQLIYDTVNMNEEAVAAQIEKMHAEETAPLFYHQEQSLRSVIKLAYFTYKDHYIKFEELPAGDGYADIVYLPKRDSGMPALVIELKWDRSAEGAIAQIKGKRYPDVLKGYGSDVLLVGISYDKDPKAGGRKHSCRIEKVCLE